MQPHWNEALIQKAKEQVVRRALQPQPQDLDNDEEEVEEPRITGLPASMTDEAIQDPQLEPSLAYPICLVDTNDLLAMLPVC